MCIYIYIYIYISVYIYIYLYIYAIMKIMCPPGYRHNGFVATHALGHGCMVWWISCHKGVVVITSRAHYFYDPIHIMLCFCEIWAICVLWIMYDHFYIYIYIYYIYMVYICYIYIHSIYIYVYIYIYIYISIYIWYSSLKDSLM